MKPVLPCKTSRMLLLVMMLLVCPGYFRVLAQQSRPQISKQPARVARDWVRDGVIYEVYPRQFSAPGNFNDATESAAGVETIDPITMDHTIVMAETAVGGSVAEVAANVSCGAAIVADASTQNATSLVSFAVDGSHLSAAVLSTPGFSLRGLLWTNETPPRLLVGDATNSGGTFYVHVFSADAQTCALTKAGPDMAMPNMPALAFAD